MDCQTLGPEIGALCDESFVTMTLREFPSHLHGGPKASLRPVRELPDWRFNFSLYALNSPGPRPTPIHDSVIEDRQTIKLKRQIRLLRSALRTDHQQSPTNLLKKTDFERASQYGFDDGYTPVIDTDQQESIVFFWTNTAQ